MDIKNLETQTKKDFNNAVCLIGVIPFIVFVYILVGKIASFKILTGEVGYILLITMVLLLLGIMTSRQMLWAIITRLIEFNQRITELQEKIIEKNRLAAITETTLALSHEINNPLMVVRGNIDLIEDDLAKNNAPDSIRQKVTNIKNHCERIRQVTDKLANLSKPVSSVIHGDAKMIDLKQSQ